MPIFEAECSGCGAVYEWYAPPGSDTVKPCEKCGGAGELLYSRFCGKVFNEFVTRNIMPDGTPVHITSQSQLSHLCNEHKLIHHDDPKWQPKSQTFADPHEVFGSRDVQEAMRGVVSGACRREELLT
jgi:hypothetical protein